TLYVKMSGLGLWRHVASILSVEPGILNFLCGSVADLKAALRARDDFSRPEESDDDWTSRERRARGQLHFKHFRGWTREKVQAHVDPYGLLPRSDAWWLLPVVPLVQMMIHGITRRRYTDPFAVRRVLSKQGWDPKALGEP